MPRIFQFITAPFHYVIRLDHQWLPWLDTRVAADKQEGEREEGSIVHVLVSKVLINCPPCSTITDCLTELDVLTHLTTIHNTSTRQDVTTKPTSPDAAVREVGSPASTPRHSTPLHSTPPLFSQQVCPNKSVWSSENLGRIGEESSPQQPTAAVPTFRLPSKCTPRITMDHHGSPWSD
ncbi:hypothetical protein TcWFU_000199 [Taenia crassiceps]|uniref:Uncharacterized protein n=1 Tax=Taenia crassiceps TaxID=6207 RepID=A0ABR4QAD8_9CEST